MFLLRCLHEAQDPSLCLYVAHRLVYQLNLREASLSPLDCLSISYFLFTLTEKEVIVYLQLWSIGEYSVKCLTRYLSSNVDRVRNVTINLHDSRIDEIGAAYVSWLLYFIKSLRLSSNPIGDTGVSLISEAVRETAALKTLILYYCNFTSRGAEDLSNALAQNSSLEKLDISNNNLGDEGISHVAEALKQNEKLKELWMDDCGLSDKGAASLASALRVNNSLKVLHIGGPRGSLTEGGLSTITKSLYDKSEFVELATPYGFYSITSQLREEVNEARKRNGLPPIIFQGKRLP